MVEGQKRSGFFLVLDGIDGCGKSTQSKKITDYLQTKKIPCHLTAEPSKGELGQILRKYLKDSHTPAALDALLFASDRLEHCQKEILPRLSDGNVVISDRYRDSSYVYQSIQGEKEGLTEEWIRELNKFSIEPDLTIILDIDPKSSLKRKVVQSGNHPAELEKFEVLEFQEKIRKSFQKIATLDKSKKHQLINATASEDQIFQEILKIIEPLLKLKGIIK